MDAAALVDKLLGMEVLLPIIIGGGIIVVSLTKAIVNGRVASAREVTRREIAAFIAEGSMSPDQGERLMNAGDRLPRI